MLMNAMMISLFGEMLNKISGSILSVELLL